jgi:hypothetical protein
VFQAVRRIVECSPLLKREAKITQDRIVFPAFNATIAAIASDAGSAAAGPNPIREIPGAALPGRGGSDRHFPER